jgi:hypothetical protein
MNRDRSHGQRMQRRQFLANLLFAGGALTLAGLRSAQAAEHPTDGWTLPDLNAPDPKPSPSPTPEPPPILGEPSPPPPLMGKPLPPAPHPRGKVRIPEGEYGPPKPGEAVAPPPPPKERKR